jgi:hypothetical protein
MRLKEYCDLVFGANTDAEGTVLTKKLQTHLVEIYYLVKSELMPDRIETVFFPYQLNTWDSLESIYLAAVQDTECDVYVVPIPWFEKRPDDTLGEMRYDGDRYPEHVPVTNWRDYDTEARRPDVVFINNPYDDQSYATSVHPDYYSERLWGMTELLCFCPYFVCLDDIHRDFAVSTGATNADKVFVQSEKIRAGLIREVNAFAEEVGRIESVAGYPGRVVALGSPKYDRVIHPRDEDFTLPAEWRRLIEKQDGSMKKTVLYNTNITGILHGADNMLNKLRHVHDIFRRRDDAVLWWRPHPLSSAVINTMAPQLASEYKGLIEEYKREGFGIFDDTPDLHRSLQMSDILYGDATSLVALYQCMEKPVLIQGISNSSEADEQTTQADPASAIYAKIHHSTKAVECLFIENVDGILLEHMLSILALPDRPVWLTELLKKQRELKLGEIASPDGTAGAAIWEYCRTSVLR